MSNIPTSGSLNINIIFSDENNPAMSQGSPTNPANPVQMGKPKAKAEASQNGEFSTTQVMIANAAMNMAKQAVNAAISNIGIMTGDYISQKNFQSVISVGAETVGFGTAIASKNYIGATVMLLSKATSLISDALREKKERENQKVQSEVYFRRAGFRVNENR